MCRGFWIKSDDVPDHRQSYLCTLPKTLAGALRVANAPTEPDWNFNNRQTVSQRNQQHVRRKVISPDLQLGKDAVEGATAHSPKGTADVCQAGRPKKTTVPESEPQ